MGEHTEDELRVAAMLQSIIRSGYSSFSLASQESSAFAISEAFRGVVVLIAVSIVATVGAVGAGVGWIVGADVVGASVDGLTSQHTRHPRPVNDESLAQLM